MENNENKKSFEALADEALDAVTGGKWCGAVGVCFVCQKVKTLAQYHDPNNRSVSKCMCADCARDLGYVP